MGNRPTLALPRERDSRQPNPSQGQQSTGQSAVARSQSQASQQQQQQPAAAVHSSHPPPSSATVAPSSQPSQDNQPHPSHRREQQQHHRRRSSATSTEGERSNVSASSVASSSSAASTTTGTRDSGESKPAANPKPTQKKKRSRRKRSGGASREQVAPKAPSCETVGSGLTTEEKDRTVEKTTEAPLLVKRKRYKNVIKPKEENTEFEKVKVKARPATSKKNAAAAASKNMERLMANNDSGDKGGDVSPQLRSFEECEDECELKSAKPEFENASSDVQQTPEPNQSSDIPPNDSKDAPKVGGADKDRTKEDIKTTDNASNESKVPPEIPSAQPAEEKK